MEKNLKKNIYITEPLCCTPETHNIVNQLYFNKKIFFKINGPTLAEQTGVGHTAVRNKVAYSYREILKIQC